MQQKPWYKKFKVLAPVLGSVLKALEELGLIPQGVGEVIYQGLLWAAGMVTAVDFANVLGKSLTKK